MGLSNIELDIAKEIVNISLAKAADSLSFFIKQKVLISESNIAFETITSESIFTAINSNKLIALKTEIKGDFEGNCYLILSSEDRDKILELTLPENVLKDPIKKKEFGDGVLLEIDNIVTASVVTQFSNLLKYKMHGYVPFISEFGTKEINKYLYEDNKNQDVLLSIKTRFNTEKDKLKPEFVWFMNKSKFIEGVKNHCK